MRSAAYFAANLRRLMGERGLSGPRLARLARVDRWTVARIFRVNCEPNLRTAVLLARALGVTLDDLVRAP